MEDRFLPANISVHDFDALLKRYPDTIPRGSNLEKSEHVRLRVVPEALQQRRDHGDAFMTKEEAVALLEWKLSHGTFRPSLRSLVASNTPTQIETATREAFALLPSDFAADLASPADITPSISKLSTLRGIGPATASLFLNTHTPSEIPFFSDELYRWLRFTDAPDAKGAGKGSSGWERRIAYTGKEYMALVRRICLVRKRLRALGRDVGARDIECVAYVLGRTDVEDIPVENGTAEKPQTMMPHMSNETDGFEALARGVMAAIDQEHARSVETRAEEEKTRADADGEDRRKRRRKD